MMMVFLHATLVLGAAAAYLLTYFGADGGSGVSEPSQAARVIVR